MAPATEPRIVALQRDHPSWGPQRVRHELTKEGLDPVPGRTSVYRRPWHLLSYVAGMMFWLRRNRLSGS